MPSRTPTRGGEDATREVFGWLVAGCFNAPFLYPEGEGLAPFSRLGLHATDLAHAAALGVVSAGCVVSTSRLPRAIRLGLAALGLTLLGAFALREDLQNLAERLQVPSYVLRFACGALAALGFLALRSVRRACQGLVLPWAALAVALGLAFVNNRLVPRDYPGAHLWLSACTACVAMLAAQPFRPLSAAWRRSLRWGCLALVPALMPALLLRVDSPIWKRLLVVPGSVVAPYVAALRTPQAERGDGWLERRYPRWFPGGRRAVPPTGAVSLPEQSLVFLLTVDALRADVVASGEHDSVLPSLARLRDTSTWFAAARSPSPSTLSTISSIFSGKYYSGLYWTKDGNDVLPRADTSIRLPELLAAAGVRTAQAVPMRALTKNHGATRGFAEEALTSRHYGHAVEVMDRLLAQVEAQSEQSAFFFAHFIDPHAPYTLGGTRGSDFERYIAEVAMVDRQLGRLREWLTEQGLEQRSILIVSADHGEAFGEHGRSFHSTTLYEELLRVPLLVAIPGLAKRRIDEPVTLLDLAPTVLDLFGLPAPAQFMGQSLAPLLVGARFQAERPIAADSGRRVQSLIFPDGIKAIRDLAHQTQEVYDLNQDPSELHDLTAVGDARAERYLAGLEHFFAAHTLRVPGWQPPWRKF